MGFNPFRPQSKTTLDVAIVVFFALVIVALVVWGFAG